MHSYCYIFLLLLIALVSCGETSQPKPSDAVASEELESINFDSLYGVMDERYNRLCEYRSNALKERDAKRRQQLLEANDRACAEFQDSLQRIIVEEQRLQL